MRTLLLFAALAVSAAAQPASLSLSTAPTDRLDLPALDNQALVDRYDAARRSDVPAPLRFAEPVQTSVRADQRPGWEVTASGDRVWRLVVSSPGAYSMSFGFSQFRLPEGARLWIYPEGGTPEYRPFTHEDNEAHGQLWTPIVPGDRAVVEVNLPPTKEGYENDFDLVLGQVNHAFRPTLLTQKEKDELPSGARLSGSCNVDVVCPEGDGYRDIARSVGAYTVQGVEFCSGAAINNTSEDGRPLFLTANHCGISPGNEAAVVVYWNYESTTCRATGSPASGSGGNGSRREFNTGTTELGDGATSDWSLLEFDDPILPSAYVYLSGWDRRDIAPSSAVAIHHPSVEEKRISFENDATTITTYGSNTQTSSGTHIRVIDWDLGTTEGGSSGSPLFNADKQIVGQLHGGSAACGNNASDWYGRLHRSMNDGLAALLDPGGTGAQTLDGKGVPFALASISTDRVVAGETFRLTFVTGNPTGTDISTATLAATIPAGFSYAGNVSTSIGTASVSGNDVTWTGALAAGAELVLSYDVTVGADTPYAIHEHSATADIGGSVPLTDAVTTLVLTPRATPTLVYEATPAVAIPDNQCPTFRLSTINVTEDLEVARVSVGISVTHTWRGDLSARLISPAGTTVDLFGNAGGSGNSTDNLDVLLDDAGVRWTLGSASHNAGAPYYEFEVGLEAGAQALTSMVGERTQGTWTLGICDGAGQDTGTLNRWALYLVSSGATAEDEGVERSALAVELVGPNPVASATRARISVDRPQAVRVTLVDATGRTVRVLHAGEVQSGATVALDAAGLSAGTYFVRVEGDGQSRTLPVSVVR